MHAPEHSHDRVPTRAADAWALGALLSAFVEDEPVDANGATVEEGDAAGRLRAIVTRLLAEDPDQRPGLADVARALRGAAPIVTGATDATDADAKKRVARLGPGDRLGRFEIVEERGQGGMGRVFRATDAADGRDVALKVLLPGRAADDLARRRFLREARILSQLRCSEVARYIDANEEGGVLYLAMELVDGRTLRDVVAAGPPLSEERALDLVIDVARALADVHDLGVVHRDVKPSNVLVFEDATQGRPRAKLCDFGIARRLDVEATVALTSAGAAPGTPWYMAPEQCRGEPADAQSDVYALGATLFHALVGEAPYPDRDVASVFAGHLNEPTPDVRDRRPGLTEDVARVIARALEKEQDHRYATAREMLRDLERVRHGEPAEIEDHPRPSEAARNKLRYRFEWALRSPPSELWPYVADTNRLNRAVGLSPVEFTHRAHDDGVETRGRMSAMGGALEWREHPFEWVAPTRLGVLREYSAGPFLWLRSTVDLEPLESGGTHLVHVVEVAPRSIVGRAAASLEIGVRLRRAFGRAYKRIDEVCTLARGALAASGGRAPVAISEPPDPFEPTPRLGVDAESRLRSLHDQLLALGQPPAVVEVLVDHLRSGTPQQVGHIRPLALADRARVDRDALVTACLHAVQKGALLMLWDILCPSCRIPSSIADTLAALREHAHCDACNLDFEVDLARSVEVVFRVHPAIRPTDVQTYCVGGPAHSPHVLAQVRLAIGERFELEPELAEGAYVITGRWMPRSWSFRVTPEAPHDEWSLSLASGLAPSVARSLRPGLARVTLHNDLAREAIVRLERAASRSDAFTAAHAASHPRFRELFPTELLSPGQLVGVSQVTVVFAEPPGMGALYKQGDDHVAFDHVVRLKASVDERAAVEGGTLVKLVGNGVMAVFHEPIAALRAGLALRDEVRDARIVVHSGAAMMTTINERLDYFGRLVHEAELLLDVVGPGELLVTEATITDPTAAALFSDRVRAPSVLVREGVLAHRASAARDIGDPLPPASPAS